MPLRVMTYNIKNGGRDGRTTSRLDRIVEVINSAAPDVLGLQELRGFSSTGHLAELADAVGMLGFLARSWFGQPVAVLVRPSARVERVAPVRRPFHHAVQRVVMASTAGPLRVLSAHLNPYSGTRRLVEARWLAAACRGEPLTLLMGDLNSLDPWTDHGDRIGRLPAAHRGRHLLRNSSTADTRAISVLERAGLVDLFRTAGRGDPDTVPTRHGGAEFSGMRLDYLFGTPALAARTRRCTVVRGGVAEVASDHHPVIGDLDVDFQ